MHPTENVIVWSVAMTAGSSWARSRRLRPGGPGSSPGITELPAYLEGLCGLYAIPKKNELFKNQEKRGGC